jgi:hypothetical protein
VIDDLALEADVDYRARVGRTLVEASMALGGNLHGNAREPAVALAFFLTVAPGVVLL